VWRHLSLVLVAVAAFAADPPESPLTIRALAIPESDGQVWRVNVSVGNRSQTTFTGLKVSVAPGGAAPWEIPALAPSEWKNNTIALNAGNYRSLVAITAYSSGNRADAIAEPVQMRDPEKPWWTGAASAAAPVALGAFIGLLGVLITSLFSLNKERLTAQLQWNRFLVEHYDGQYRLFLTRCGGVVQANALKTHFTQLDETALVPSRLRAVISDGIQAVEREPDADKQRAARDRLLGLLRSELLEPFAKKERRWLGRFRI
jgi:hypothetical protein